ncbi:hypothetical protein [Thioclava sp. GXIMD4215]|uniref:hypothetical protein n=1 Tax=Thioclava sp. GXIMD4215 TaxID=3131928 RepID=UPI00311B1A50
MSLASSPLELVRVSYADLNSRQKETYNFHRTAARLVEYGYNSILLSDDWLGADFIAYHNDGQRFYRIQLKGRLTIDNKYVGRDLYIAFWDGDRLYIYPHDEMADRVDQAGHIVASASWREHRSYSWPSVPKWARQLLVNFEVFP